MTSSQGPSRRSGRWDAIVVGAGPAGSTAAHDLSRRGFSVLLVDRATFPRNKVCGGCLSARAIALLQTAGLGPALSGISGCPLTAVTIATPRGRPRTFTLPEGRAISRAELDQRLVDAAVREGTVFHGGVSARVLPMARSDDTTRRVALVGGDVREIVRARVVVVADGLLHPSLSTLPALGREVRKASRIGVGAVLFAPGSADTGTVRMAIARSGYVGMVGVGHGRLNVAAALDTRAVRAHGPGATIAGILEACGHRPDSSIADARWHGTPALSRRLIRPAGRRLLVLGDASGYSEPFTGEGMAWALSDALAAGRLLSRGLADWDPRIESEWLGHLRTRGRRGWTSGAVARILRSPVATRAAVTLAAGVPALARGTIRAFQSPYRPLPKASA